MWERLRRAACAGLGIALTACAGPPSGPAPCPAPPEASALAASASLEVPAGDAQRGARLFERECARCHAPLQQDRASRLFRGYPRLDCTAYLERAPAAYLFVAIAEGGPAVARDEAMKPFGDVLTRQEIADLVAFLRREL